MNQAVHAPTGYLDKQNDCLAGLPSVAESNQPANYYVAEPAID
jgi:hypothetical protein